MFSFPRKVQKSCSPSLVKHENPNTPFFSHLFGPIGKENSVLLSYQKQKRKWGGEERRTLLSFPEMSKMERRSCGFFFSLKNGITIRKENIFFLPVDDE